MSAQAAVVFSESNRVVASESQVNEALEAAIAWSKYDGERVKGSDGPAIYLVLNGQLRWVPDPTTYTNLFMDWNGVVVSDYLVNSIPKGPQLTSGAVLVKSPSSAPQYLVTNGQKLWIPNPDVVKKFYFNSAKLVSLPQVVVDAIPQGANIG